MPGPDDSKPETPKRITNGLVAASCAAVLAVYAAGYTRTQGAADRLASQIAKRRASVSTPQQARLSIKDSAGFREAEHIEHGEHRRPVDVIPGPIISPPKPPELTSQDVLPDPIAPAVPTVPVEPAAPAPTIAVAPTSFLPPPPDPAPATIAAPAEVWKDGSYSGWGYSRHGNIEATVVIESGRIASAVISQCRTRYSCSVIDRLPPQVAQRQSPDVDYVSGATQSADAFYGAVVEALGKAKSK